MADEPIRTTQELRCPFLDCRSEKVANVGYDELSGRSGQSFDERLFQCQECERKFLYLGDLSLDNNDRQKEGE
jgi:hypothetical protein